LTWVTVAELARSELGRATFLKKDPSSLEQSISGISTIELENNAAAQAIMVANCPPGTPGCTQNSVTAAQFARSVEELPANVPFVLGRYAPMNALLVIDIYKVARRGNITGLYHASFTPAHGEYWAAAKTYEDATSKGLPGFGPNPFKRFDCGPPTNPSFCSIGMDGAEVALGHAMRFAGAPIGILIVANPQVSTTITTSGDVTNQTMTVSQAGTIGASWYIAAPAAFQTNAGTSQNTGGTSAAICVADPLISPCPTEQIAYALAVFNQWQGGSFSTEVSPQITCPNCQTTTVSGAQGPTAAFAAFAATFTSSTAFMQTFGGTLAGKSDPTGTNVVANLEAFPIQIGFSAAGFTPTGSPVTVGVPSPGTIGATSTQSSLYAGVAAASNPQLSGYASAAAGGGTAIASTGADNNPATQALIAALIQNEKHLVIDPTLDSNFQGGLTAIAAYTYGSCPAAKTSKECTDTNIAQGNLPRKDAYTEVNMRSVYQDTPSN
jgi:hypothetical protein